MLHVDLENLELSTFYNIISYFFIYLIIPFYFISICQLTSIVIQIFHWEKLVLGKCKKEIVLLL